MITILYGGHTPQEITKQMEEVIRHADIIVLENALNYSESQKAEKILNEVANGTTSPFQVGSHAMYHSVIARLNEIVYGTKAKIYLERGEMSDLIKDDERSSNITYDLFNAGKIDEAVRSFRDYTEVFEKAQKARDIKAADFLAQIQDSNRQKNIASYRGSAHTVVYHILKKRGFQVKRMFPHMPYVFRLQGEVGRRFEFGKEVSDSLIVKTLGDVRIQTYFVESGYSVDEALVKSGEIMEKITEQDVRELSSSIGKIWWPEINSGILTGLTGDWLEDKGYLG